MGLRDFDFTSNRPGSCKYRVAALAEHPMASAIFDLEQPALFIRCKASSFSFPSFDPLAIAARQAHCRHWISRFSLRCIRRLCKAFLKAPRCASSLRQRWSGLISRMRERKKLKIAISRRMLRSQQSFLNCWNAQLKICLLGRYASALELLKFESSYSEGGVGGLISGTL